MKKIFSVLLMSILGLGVMAESYEINDEIIDFQIEAAEDITVSTIKLLNGEIQHVGNAFGSIALPDDGMNKELLGGIVGIAALVLFSPAATIFPVHRFIIGVGGKGAKIWALYCFTLGGCGVISLVDSIVLILDGSKNGSKYLDNSKFIIW